MARTFTMENDYKRLEFFATHTGLNTAAIIQLLNDNDKRFMDAYGSAHNHQNWKGGYYDHILEFCNIANRLYKTLNACRPLEFTLSSVYLIAFLHDLEKPWKYEVVDQQLRLKPEFNDRSYARQFKLDLMRQYGIVLTEEEQNAFDYVEGEIGNYSPYGRRMGKLAAFCHMCDVVSARLWPEHPLEGDPWPGSNEWSYRR